MKPTILIDDNYNLYELESIETYGMVVKRKTDNKRYLYPEHIYRRDLKEIKTNLQNGNMETNSRKS